MITVDQNYSFLLSLETHSSGCAEIPSRNRLDLEPLATSKTFIKFDLAVRARKTDRIDSEKIRHKNQKINAMQRRVRIIAMVFIRQYYGISIFCTVLFLPFFRLLTHNIFSRTRSSLCNNVKFILSMEYPQATPLIM